MNYSEIETRYSLGNVDFNLNYLKEENWRIIKSTLSPLLKLKKVKMVYFHLIIKEISLPMHQSITI